MTLTRLTSILAALLVAASAFAQFTKDQKDQVLDEMDQVLSQEAFVPGVDLGKWRTFVDSRKDGLENAETPREFADVVNGALRQFGLSHIQLLPGGMRRHWGGEGVDSNVQTLMSEAQGRRFARKPELKWIDDDSALIRIPDFESDYDPDVVSGLFDQAKNAKNLVVDLRGDPGGEVENMRHFLGLLMPSGTPIGTFVSRRMATAYSKENGSGSDPIAIAAWAHREFKTASSDLEPFKGKVAVLVDGGSASAAEIVANALHEERSSPIVGSKTMGAVLVSTFGRLSYGFRMQFPVGDYVSHDGHRLEGHPLTPDVAATGTGAVDAALARLKG